MSLWDFVGGAADATLDKRKRDMAAQLQKDLEEQRRNFQMTLEQQRAERDFDKDRMNAESENLNRMRLEEKDTLDRAERAKQREADEAYRNQTLSMQGSNAAAAAAERKAAAEDRGLARRIQLAGAGLRLTESGDLERDPNFSASAPQFKSADIVNLAKAVSEVTDATVRQAAQNAMDVGDYTGAASILAGRQKPTTPSNAIFIPPPKG